MRIIKPSFEIWKQEEGLEGVYKQIERAGRVCYKSEDKITETSAKEFVERMVKSGHGAMLEHGTVYLNYSSYEYFDKENGFPLNKYEENPYSKCMIVKYPLLSKIEGWVTTNLRVLVENGWLDDLKYICEPTECHAKRHTVKFICDRGVSHEFVRHRVFSFAQESTRYCNYSKDKFGNELTFIIPSFFDTGMGELSNSLVFEEWKSVCAHSERAYNKLLKYKATPQQARAVLPNSLKTELVMTGFVSDWRHFFRLRSRIAETGKPHPQAQELADPLMDEFIKRGIMETLL